LKNTTRVISGLTESATKNVVSFYANLWIFLFLSSLFVLIDSFFNKLVLDFG
jgi:hypothetical protein